MSLQSDRIIAKLDQYLSKNDYTSAKNHLLYWLNEAKAVNDQKVELLITNELMGLCRKLSEKEEALSFAQNALALIVNMNIEQNIGAATTYLNSATVYKAFNMPERAIPLFEKAKTIYETSLLPYDKRLSGLYNNMGLALVDLSRFTEANSFYKKAITILQMSDGTEPEQAITYLNMATAAEAEFGLLDAADSISDLLQQAMILLDQQKDSDDGNYAFVCEKCASVFGYYGYFAYENELKNRYRRIYERS